MMKKRANFDNALNICYNKCSRLVHLPNITYKKEMDKIAYSLILPIFIASPISSNGYWLGGKLLINSTIIWFDRNITYATEWQNLTELVVGGVDGPDVSACIFAGKVLTNIQTLWFGYNITRCISSAQIVFCQQPLLGKCLNDFNIFVFVNMQ